MIFFCFFRRNKTAGNPGMVGRKVTSEPGSSKSQRTQFKNFRKMCSTCGLKIKRKVKNPNCVNVNMVTKFTFCFRSWMYGQAAIVDSFGVVKSNVKLAARKRSSLRASPARRAKGRNSRRSYKYSQLSKL